MNEKKSETASPGRKPNLESRNGMFGPSCNETLSKECVVEPVVAESSDGYAGYALSAAEKVKYRRKNCNNPSSMDKKEKTNKIKISKKSKNIRKNKSVKSMKGKSTKTVKSVEVNTGTEIDTDSTSCKCAGCRLPPCGQCTVCKGSVRLSENKIQPKCLSRICHRGGFVWRQTESSSVETGGRIRNNSVETFSRIKNPTVPLTRIQIPRELLDKNLNQGFALDKTMYFSDEDDARINFEVDSPNLKISLTSSASKQETSNLGIEGELKKARPKVDSCSWKDREGFEEITNPLHLNVHVTDSEDDSPLQFQPGNEDFATLLLYLLLFHF